MATSKYGMNSMYATVDRAPGDIKHRLWSLYWLVRMTHLPGGTVVECGTRGGDSTRALLAGAADLPDIGHVCSYDVEDCSRSVGDPELERFWSFLRLDSVSAAVRWYDAEDCVPELIDLVFIDTDHTLATTRAEIAAWSRKVRVGGCLCFHDYWLHDPPRDEHAGHGVKMAVDEWTNANPQDWLLETWDQAGNGDTGMALLHRKK